MWKRNLRETHTFDRRRRNRQTLTEWETGRCEEEDDESSEDGREEGFQVGERRTMVNRVSYSIVTGVEIGRSGFGAAMWGENSFLSSSFFFITKDGIFFKVRGLIKKLDDSNSITFFASSFLFFVLRTIFLLELFCFFVLQTIFLLEIFKSQWILRLAT